MTVQALKILSALETKPQLALLVTQADRLVQMGEDVSDARALLVRHVPVFGPYVQNVDVLAVSAVCLESDVCGLLPLVASLLKETAMYKEKVRRWTDLLRQMENGEVLSAKEAADLKVAADALASHPSARAFLDAMSTVNTYLAEQREIDEIVRQSPTDTELLRQLELFGAGTRLAGSKKRIERLKLLLRERKEDMKMGICYLCLFLGVVFAAILCMIIASCR